MKRTTIKLLTFIAIITSGLFMGSCIDPSYEVLFEDAAVEFDAAVWNTPATGVTYPIMTRVPAQGTATTSANPTITRTTGSVALRINLVSRQLSTEQSFTVSAITPATTAQSGVHYTLPSSVVVPANSSFGTLNITILNPGATSGSVDLIIELTGNETVKASENYKKVGIRIAQN